MGLSHPELASGSHLSNNQNLKYPKFRGRMTLIADFRTFRTASLHDIGCLYDHDKRENDS